MASETKWRLTRASYKGVDHLDDEQATAARPQGGTRIVLGGPGTGKSTVIAHAVVERLRAGSVMDRLVVLAATRSAAQELRRAIVGLKGGAEVGARVTTIHGFALGLMREFGEPGQDFRLLRAPEQEQRLRDLLEGLPADFWPVEYREAARTRVFARQLREVLARARQLGLDPDRVEELAGEDQLFRAIGRFFELHLTITDFHGALDYTELLHRARLLLTDDSVGESVTARLDAVFVDDAQELDEAATALLTDLARLGLPLLAAGDPKQRLGAYRGATASALVRLRELPGAGVVHLRTGYRNGAAVTAALGVLGANLGASLSPTPAAGPQGVVSVSIYDDPSAETAHVAMGLRRAIQEGCQWRDLAVVARRGGAELELLARELAALGIPVDVDGQDRALGGQPAVRSLLALLAAAADPKSVDIGALLTGPAGGLDAMGLRRLRRGLLVREPNGDSTLLLAEAGRHPETLAAVPGEEAAAARRLLSLVNAASSRLQDGAEVPGVLWQLWAGTPWPDRLRSAALSGNSSSAADLDGLTDLFDLAARRTELCGTVGAATFIAEVEREEIAADTLRELTAGRQGVRLLTAHRARSGVWRRVFIVGVSEGSWPRARWQAGLLDPDRLAPDHIDAVSPMGHVGAERRAFYVACARAVEELHVSCCRPTEERPDAPSRFTRELGVTPVESPGRPSGFLSGQALVADLRRVAEDPAASPSLRRAAAYRLARISHRDASPTNWWGLQETSFLPWVMPEPVVITGSSLQALLRCPRQWFLARQGGGDRGRNTGATVGDVVHLIAQRAARDDLDIEAMLAQLDQAWPGLRFSQPWRADAERVRVEEALRRFELWHRTRATKLLGVEVGFAVELEVAGSRVKLRGTVDRLEVEDGRLSIVDLKTTRKAATKAELATHAQLGVYQLAARLGAFDHLARELEIGPPSLLQLRHGKTTPQQQYQEVLPTGRTWLDDQLEQAVTILRSGRFEARESELCAWCAFKDSCPAAGPGGLR